EAEDLHHLWRPLGFHLRPEPLKRFSVGAVHDARTGLCARRIRAFGWRRDQRLDGVMPEADELVGFGHPSIKALIPPPPEGPDSPGAQPGPRIMHGADAEPFQRLRAKMEAEWTPQMMQVLGL